MPVTLEHPQGNLHVGDLEQGRRRISLEPPDPGATRSGEDSWDTEYPLELIEAVLAVKGHSVCDEIRRDEDPSYVQRHLELALLGYTDPRSFRGKRLLDLGCGCGSSSLNLTRLLEGVEIVGVELEAEFVELARKRAISHGIPNISFHHSEDGQSLPAELGRFDFIVLSAVFEHLLPAEREQLLPMLWKRLNPGGVLFVNQLPHRYSPFESHTTGLPLINYLPDKLAHLIARRFSSRCRGDESWEVLLRRGIRGGSVNEILGLIRIGAEDQPVLLEPNRLGLNDRIDLWYELSAGTRWTVIKRAIRVALKGLRKATGITFVPDLALAIQKPNEVLSPRP